MAKPPALAVLIPDEKGEVTPSQVSKVNNSNYTTYYKVEQQLEALQSWIRKIDAGDASAEPKDR